MNNAKKNLHPITILFFVIVIAAISTWVLPTGTYKKLKATDKNFVILDKDNEIIVPLTQATLDSLHLQIPLKKFVEGDIKKPVSIPNTYKKTASHHAGFLALLQAPVKGIYDTIDIILFVLVLGGFIQVFNETGAMVKGIGSLSKKMKGNEKMLIIILTSLFSFGGSSYGMAEEALVFYPVLVPLFLAAGYDLIIPVAVIFGGTQIGTLSSFSNPFSTIIASNAAGINWADGIYERLIMFVLSTTLFIVYILRYAEKVRKNPSASFLYAFTQQQQTFKTQLANQQVNTTLTIKDSLLLIIFGVTFLTMVAGVIFLKWWLLELTTLFIASSLLLLFVGKLTEQTFIQQFIKGAESLLAVAFIIGIARGITIVLNDGNISDTLLYYTTQLLGNMPPQLFVIMLIGIYILFTFFISSSSGMAVLTMPIFGALAFMLHIPGKEIVNSYLAGMGIMGFVTPTGLILPSLAMVNINMKAWMKFITPFLILLFILCAIWLVVGLYY